MKKHLFYLIVMLQSCAQFQLPMPMDDFESNRSANIDVFKPHRDFPVVAGDEDMDWDRPAQRLQQSENYRSPASSYEHLKFKNPSFERVQEAEDTRGVPTYFRTPRASTVGMGMSKEEVMDQLGRPTKVEIAGNPENENERWGYLANGAMKYIYFESGYVEGWE